MLALTHALALALPGAFSGPDGHLVLVHTDVHAQVVADLAVVDVVQTFENPFDHPIDATYVFPLPVDAAVRDMTVTCGERTIRSDLLRRDEASARYEEAVRDGRRAALTEQQRDNLFTQKVSGICPGEVVAVTLQYVESVDVDEGVHSFVFPTTVGPRYEPGDLIEPPVVEVERPSRGVSLRLEVRAGGPLGSIWSDSHPLAVVGEDDQGADIELLELQEAPDQDVHVAWTTAGETTRAVTLAGIDEQGDAYLSLSMIPPDQALSTDLRPRELVFVMDSSCSMSGEPWDAAVATVNEALDHLREGERFNLVRFSDAAGKAFPSPQPATPATLARARQWMRSFEGGGTEMEAGMVEALDMPGDPESLRMVWLLTDGYIGDEAHLFQVARQHMGPNDRIFALGIGSSVNRLLIEGMAHHGRGASSVWLPGTPIAEEVARFYRRVDQPVLTDIEVDWGELGAVGEGLDAPPDLFAGQPLHLVARVDGSRQGVVTVRGRRGGEPVVFTLPVDLREATPHAGLPTLWARRQIAAVDWNLDRPAPDRDREVEDLAMRFRLVSRMTSLVAVDDRAGACGGGVEVAVPQLLPAGVDPGLVGGLLGTKGSGAGIGGLGTRGTGIGGGGIAGGTVGYGRGGGNFGGTTAGQGAVTQGAPAVTGSLDTGAIRKVIVRQMNAIRYCYLRELASDPSLAGRVVIRFVVNADGGVTAVETREDSLGNAAVSACLVGRFQRMVFPAVPGGGQVEVTYPLTFSPGP